MSRRALVLLPVLVLLSACGQRGDLYFPAEERDAVLTVPAQPQSPAQPGADEDNDDTTTRPDATTNPNPDAAGR